MRVPLIAEIKRNSLDDGPGIRSTVFFKGCPLRCSWCHNPECIEVDAELSYRAGRCLDCRRCAAACTHGAIAARGPAELDRSLCDLCGDCARGCPPRALEVVGRTYSVEELAARLLVDRVFFANSGGGVTLSGGEPALHPEYAGALARRLREEGVPVLIQTSGAFDRARFEEHLLPALDLVYVDLKLVDPEEHRLHCGQDNRRILDTIRWLLRGPLPTLVRVPLIPGITDTERNLTGIREFLRREGQRRIGVIPYNPLWTEKARGIGRCPSFSREAWLDETERARIRVLLAGMEVIGDV